MTGVRVALVALGLTLAQSHPAAAQAVHSAFGCSNLAGRHALPAIEGTGAMFYRVHPDLHMFHPFSDETVADLSRLSAALAARGTTLIYVPLPTTALVEPEALPPLAADMGFDPAIAATLFDDIVHRLVAADVLAVNLRLPLQAPGSAATAVMPTDYRLNTEGGRRAATVIGAVIAATPGYDALPRVTHVSRAGAEVAFPSPMRDVLQRHCTLPLPLAETATVTTTAADGTSPAPAIVLAGSEEIAANHSNLAGFLAEATGLGVLEQVAPGGGAFAAMTAYLTSDAFAQSPPAYVVWVNPVQHGLAAAGDLPMAELVAAAAATCTTPLATAPGPDPASLTVTLPAPRPAALFIDAAAPVTALRVDLSAAAGTIRTRHIARHGDAPQTGRFYLSLTGMPEDAITATVTFDTAAGAAPRVAACPD